MFDLRIYHIIFTLEATTRVHMGAQAGAQIRGALWEALNVSACIAPNERHHPFHAEHCPMCFLLELQSNSPRGQNPPRPFTIRPPLAVRAEEDRIYQAGELFEIQLTLMGKAGQLFPYLIQGMRLAGHNGVGYGRGRFVIDKIHTRHPLTGEAQSLLDGTTVLKPDLNLSAEDITNATAQLKLNHITLRFLTPTTLKQKGEILHRPDFTTLIARLLERCQALAFHYGYTSADPDIWQPRYLHLTQQAQMIRTTLDNTRFVEIQGGSRRSNRYHRIGGFVGEVQFAGDIIPFLPWLLWGQSIQVGKNIVKGSGWYQIVS